MLFVAAATREDLKNGAISYIYFVQSELKIADLTIPMAQYTLRIILHSITHVTFPFRWIIESNSETALVAHDRFYTSYLQN